MYPNITTNHYKSLQGTFIRICSLSTVLHVYVHSLTKEEEIPMFSPQTNKSGCHIEEVVHRALFKACQDLNEETEIGLLP